MMSTGTRLNSRRRALWAVPAVGGLILHYTYAAVEGQSLHSGDFPTWEVALVCGLVATTVLAGVGLAYLDRRRSER